MIDLKLPQSNSFTDQTEVDQYVLETEELAEKTFDEKTAIELYQRVSRLRTVEELYFVPDIVLSWEEMALSMIESEAAVFETVQYEYMCKLHKKGFEIFSNLESYALNQLIPIDFLFKRIHSVNIDLYEFNKYCKQYHQEILDYYVCEDDTLRKKYLDWTLQTNYCKKEEC